MLASKWGTNDVLLVCFYNSFHADIHASDTDEGACEDGQNAQYGLERFPAPRIESAFVVVRIMQPKGSSVISCQLFETVIP
jgi:hypothetical protein